MTVREMIERLLDFDMDATVWMISAECPRRAYWVLGVREGNQKDHSRLQSMPIIEAGSR